MGSSCTNATSGTPMASSASPPVAARNARRDTPERSVGAMPLSCPVVMAKSDRVAFTCNGRPVTVDIAPGESLLSVLRERLDLTSVKDGCAPQGQCGCCTVLIDGAPWVACVTAAERVDGRTVTTIEGVDAAIRDRLVDSFVATGASQCGFCTPGILVRAAAVLKAGRANDRAAVDRALAAHLPVHRVVHHPGRHRRGCGRHARAQRGPRPRRRGASRRARRGCGPARGIEHSPRRRRASPTTGTRPTQLVAVPCRPTPTRPPSHAAGITGSSRESLLAAREQSREGPGTAHDSRRCRRSTCRRAPRRGAGRDRMGGTCVPRTGRVVVCTRWRAGDAARERWRVRGEGGVAGHGRGASSSPTIWAVRCGRCGHVKTWSGSARSARRSRRARCSTGRPCTCAAPSASPVGRCQRATATGRTACRAGGTGWRPPCPVRPSARGTRACGLAEERTVLLEGALAEAGAVTAGSDRDRGPPRCCSTRA